MAPKLGLGARESRGRSYRANTSGPRVLIFEEGLVRDELRIIPNRVVVVDRSAWYVGGLDTLEPVRRRLRREQRDQAFDRSPHPLRPRLVALKPFRMTDRFENRGPMFVGERRNRDVAVGRLKRLERVHRRRNSGVMGKISVTRRSV